MCKFSIIAVLLIWTACFSADPIPLDNLQMWLQVDSVDSSTDSFLATMRNMSKRRFAVNQVELQYRPLYIKDFIQHRPVVALSDSRGFAFGTLRATTEAAVYVGYYHEVIERPAEFRIEVFGPDDILAQTSKNGFVMAIYDGMLGFHGEPGYSSAFTEFIMYDRTPTPEQDRQIRSYLMGRYGLCFDSRYIRNGPAILVGNTVSLSNIVKLKNMTLVCAAGVKQTERRRTLVNLDLIRSYNDGERWSQTIGQILNSDEYLSASMPKLYISSTGVLYCFYGEKQSNEQYKAAFKYSVDDGYNWSKVSYIDNVVSKTALKFTGHISIDGTTFFCVSSSLKPPVLLVSSNIDREMDPKNLLWKVSGKLGDAVKAADKAVLESAVIAAFQKKIFCVFNSADGFIYQTSSADRGDVWSPVMKAAAVDGSSLRNPGNFPPYLFSTGDELMMCFRNSPKPLPPQRDMIWLSKAVADNDGLRWSQPRVGIYSKEYSDDASMQMAGAVISNEGVLNAAVMSGDNAYFTQAKFDEIMPPVGIGVLELKDAPSADEYYKIPVIPSLLDGRIVIDIDTANNTLDNDMLLLRIGEDKNKIVLFTEKGRFGLYVTDGYKSAVFKSVQYDKQAAYNLVVDIDGTADIMRILVDGSSAAWDDGEGSAWVYFSEEIERITEDERLFIPQNSRAYIKKLSLHYPGISR